MQSAINIETVLRNANDKTLSETGGGHNQKGVDFQRYWSVMRMFELESEGASDFLFLFETIQDVAILDSPTNPAAITVYQVKKKDRKEWTWSVLTGLNVPGKKTKPDGSKVTESPLGKLYLAVRACEGLTTQGYFVSNAGCDLDLRNGSNAATSLVCHLGQLQPAHVALLTEGLKLLSGGTSPNLNQLFLKKVPLPVDAPDKQVVGHVVTFLEARSPRHAGQARALVDSLIAKVAPLGRKTDACTTFEELCQERGYSKQEFLDALATVESVPDVIAYLDEWLTSLRSEGVDILTTTRMRVTATAIHRRKVLQAQSDREIELEKQSQRWVSGNPMGDGLRPWLEVGYESLKVQFSDFDRNDILVNVVLQGIQQCVDQTSGG